MMQDVFTNRVPGTGIYLVQEVIKPSIQEQ